MATVRRTYNAKFIGGIRVPDFMSGLFVAERARWLWLLDLALVCISIPLALTHNKVFLFHLIFVLLTVGAFYWQLKGFVIRSGLWVGATTVILVISIALGDVHSEELLEIPLLTTILILVFAIATRRSLAEDRLREANENLEFRVAARTEDLSKANADLRKEIAERQQTEETLRASEERYRHLVELSFEAVMIHQDGNIVYVNPSGLHLIGAKRLEDVHNKPIMDFVHPDYLATAKTRLQEVQESGKGVPPLEEKFIRLDGNVVDVEIATIPIRYHGQPAMQSVVRDITERKAAETARTLERMRIARDLHDSLGQSLGYLHLKLDEFVGSQNILVIPARRPELIQLRDVAHGAYEQVREILAAFLPSNASDLPTVLLNLAESMGDQHGFAVRFTSEGLARKLPAILQQQIVYICREALNNVAKHSHASVAMLKLVWTDREIRLTIADDGCGFERDKIDTSQSFGLRIMAERADQIRATLTLQPIPAAGTTVSLQIPLDTL